MSQGFGVRNGTGYVAGAQREGKEEGRGARSRRGVSPACHATGFGSHPARDGGAGADRARGGTRSVGSPKIFTASTCMKTCSRIRRKRLTQEGATY